jgi:hypothetical protein
MRASQVKRPWFGNSQGGYPLRIGTRSLCHKDIIHAHFQATNISGSGGRGLQRYLVPSQELDAWRWELDCHGGFAPLRGQVQEAGNCQTRDHNPSDQKADKNGEQGRPLLLWQIGCGSFVLRGRNWGF